MGRRTVRVIRSGGGGGLLAMEALLIGLIDGVLLLTLGMLTAIVFLALVLNVVMIFWLWTATLAGGAGYGILRASQDLG